MNAVLGAVEGIGSQIGSKIIFKKVSENKNIYSEKLNGY